LVTPALRGAVAVPPRRARPASATTASAVAEVRAAPRPTRAEAARFLAAQYRREQFTRELALEQQRYGAEYWDAEGDGPALARLARLQAATRAELEREANAILAELFPGETGDPLELPPIFDADRRGPNVSFLSGAARSAFEAAAEEAGDFSPAALQRAAARTLVPAELELYARWNDPAAAALRDRLAGFGATETEFLALWRGAATDGSMPAAPDAGDLPALAPARRAQLRALETPELRTAVHDLRRAGLPVNDAGWLALTRTQATTAIQAVWRDPAIAVDAKPVRVAQVEREFARAIALRLGAGGVALDEFNPGQE
jgi:hypothetical protein